MVVVVVGFVCYQEDWNASAIFFFLSSHPAHCTQSLQYVCRSQKNLETFSSLVPCESNDERRPRVVM